MSSLPIELDYLAKHRLSLKRVREAKGINSQIYEFSHHGRDYVLKIYKGDFEKRQSARIREEASIRFLNRNGFSRTPTLIEQFSSEQVLCMEKLGRLHAKSNRSSARTLWESFVQLKDIYCLNPNFESAVDFANSTTDILNQIRISELTDKDVYVREKKLIEKGFKNLKAFNEIRFPSQSLTYSLSDVGTHNMMLKENKNIVFIDFEYFGKDSAVKMICDFILHPRNQFSESVNRHILKRSSKIFGIDDDCLQQAIPFFALKWCQIVLKKLSRLDSKHEIKAGKELFYHYINTALGLTNSKEIRSSTSGI
jgi:thiamine kinase-like enzyme